MRFLAVLLISFIIPFSASAEESQSLFSKFKSFVLDASPEKAHVRPFRPSGGKTISSCIEMLPHGHLSMMGRIGLQARHMANALDAREETLIFQPHFSGLKGPKITIMRKDLERTLVNKQGSSNEIYHNATFTHEGARACDKTVKAPWDIELRHHIDLWDSDESPLYRSDLIVNQRVHFGGYFLGTLGLRVPLKDNFDNDPTLRTLNTFRPVRQDVLGYAWQGISLDRLMLSGFATPIPNFYVAGHTGYLEEMFYGGGGEILYRPYDSAFALGAEFWATQKRSSYIGGAFARDKDHNQTSALINAWYDMPPYPIDVGLSYGRFLDGDVGGQIQSVYRPADGWSLKGFATLSNQDDRTLDNDTTNLYAGIKLTMPLGQFKGVPVNSRQTLKIAPFARDKGQRIDNPYPLYDLTSAWQMDKIHADWHKITE
jgi:hypothetical protein